MPPSPSWQLTALTSGTLAALNGLFAKLTTSTQTHTLPTYICHSLNLPSSSAYIINILLRLLTFTLTFVLSSGMWALYTRALKEAPSAVHAQVVNTAGNFVISALFGAWVFGETLNGTWWVGAGFLVVGSCVVGRGRVDDGVRGVKGEKKEI